MNFLAAPPGDANIQLPFSQIDWWWFTLVLAAVFILLATVRKKQWAWSALGVMVVVMLGYAGFMMYALPWLKTVIG